MSTSARRFVQSLTGRRQSDTAASSSTRLVHGHHELDEIAVVSCNATPSQVKYGSGPLSAAANGPRIVPEPRTEISVERRNRGTNLGAGGVSRKGTAVGGRRPSALLLVHPRAAWQEAD
ncbi:hypothetical protein J6590_004865 [Homalodisca vitripennis]|nr:hypothetical protein J6590_004865 [Homalodisca vitripennis]